MSNEARQITKEELVSILETIQEEIRSDKVKGLQVVLQNIVSVSSPSPYITSASLSGKQFAITLCYEEQDG